MARHEGTSGNHGVPGMEDVPKDAYRLLVNRMSQGVVVHGLDGSIVSANPAARHILGLDETSLPRRNQTLIGARNRLIRRDGGELRAQEHPVTVVMTTGRPVRDEVIGIQEADRVRWIRVCADPLPGSPDAGPGAVVATYSDITDEVEAERELTASRQRLQLVLDASRLGLWDWNMQTGETYFNERWAQIVGYDLAELEPVSIDTWVGLAHADDLAKSASLIAAHTAGETEFYDIECRMRHRDGHWVWVRDRGRIVEWDDEGKPLRMTGTHEDITALHAASEQLQASESRYRAVVHATASGLVVQAANGVIVECNPAAERMLGLTSDQLMGISSIDPRWRCIHEDGTDFPGQEHPAMVTLATGEPQIGVVMGVMTPAGGLRWLKIDSMPFVRPEAPDERSVIASFTDITASMTAERALRESQEQLQRLAENASDMVALTDVNDVLVWFSPSVSRLGWAQEEVLGHSVTDFLHPDDWGQLRPVNDLPAGVSRVEEWRFRSKTGRYHRFRVRLHTVTDTAGNVTGQVSGWQDIDAEWEVREDLRASEEKYRLLAETMSDLVEEYDPAGRLLWASPSVQTVLGWSPQEVVGRLVSELVHDEDDFDVDIQHPPIDGRSADNLEQRKRVRRLRADGSHVWVDSSLAFRFGEDGQHVGTYVTSRDIDAEVHAQAHLERSEQRFRMAMLSAPAGMALVSADDRLIQVNPALCRILGRSEQWLLGQLISELMDAEDADVDRAMRNQVLCGPEELATREHRMIRSDGQRIWVEHSIGLLRDTYGKPLSFVSQFIDVTETRRAREQLQFLATHDALTGLINRRELAARIGGLLAGPHPVGLATAVFFIDLDNFKQINDTLGHFAGDTVIATVARRLVEVVGQSDTVARIGGDEFVVVLCDLHGVAAAVRVADQIHDRVAMPVVTDGGEVAVTLSIGVAFVEDSDDFDAVLHRADTALYQAKQQGRAQTVIHHETGLSPSD